jgi:hypothetical protein
MTEPAEVDRLRTVAEALRRATGFQALLAHVIQRVHTLVGDDLIVYADSNVDIERAASGDILNGTLVVFTTNVVVRLALEGTTARASDNSATVTAEAWARRDLRHVALPTEGSDDAGWQPSQWGGPPTALRVRLEYRDVGHRLELPLRPSAQEVLAALLPTLMRDLHA